ncbi:MAG TPA: MEKHLA domain-containing protein [Verrucomicrobiae bacterium]|jgi:hypothetical protein
MKNLWQTDWGIAHTQTLARSFKHFTARDLLAGQFSETNLAQKIFAASFVVVSHGTEADPILNYGNQTALALWEMSWEEFTRTPSRLTAETLKREERAQLLEAVTHRGFVDHYSGVRISQSGRRFEIANATIWNLVSPTGQPCGQAATFPKWRFI